MLCCQIEGTFYSCEALGDHRSIGILRGSVKFGRLAATYMPLQESTHNIK